MSTHVRLMGLVLLATMIGSLLLASCSGTPTSPPTVGQSLTETKPYGSLTFALDFWSGQPDPQAGTPPVSNGGVFDSLLDGRNRAEPAKPEIAERWERSPNGLRETFYIRKGVRFHDGSDLTGADVKFSIERLIAPESVSQWVGQWRPLIASVELKDEYTVVVNLKQPWFGETKFAPVPIMPKKYIEEKGVDYFRKYPVGSGPWKIVRYETGNRFDLEAVESHWRAVPKFKNVTVLNVPEEATKIAMLKTGELDMARVGVDSISGLKSAGLRVLSYDGGDQYFAPIFYDLEHPEKYAFGDVRVRKALFWAIDRKEIIDNLFHGAAGTYLLYTVSSKADFMQNLKPDPYDPEGAKKLLAEAGYPNGFSTRLWDERRANITTSLIEAVGGYSRKIGVSAQLVPIEFATLYSMWFPKHKPEIWNSVRMLVTQEYGGWEGMAGGYHTTKSYHKNTNNPRLNELLDKLPETADPAESKRLAAEAAVLAYNEYSILRAVAPHLAYAIGPKIDQISTARVGIGGRDFETITHVK